MRTEAKVLVLDHFDSFTYNLVQYLAELGAQVEVLRTDRPFSEAVAIKPTHVALSPGPGHPKDAEMFIKAIRHWAGKLPILGVCLGHQAIAYAYGAPVVRARVPMHGKQSEVHHYNSELYIGMDNPFIAGRYHSLVVRAEDLPSCFCMASYVLDKTKTVMGIRHRDFPMEGIQFHPESILTDQGKILLANFLKQEGGRR